MTDLLTRDGKPRKRARGGGRPPKGEFADMTSGFSTRIPDKLRAQLEEAAKKNGKSLTQEIVTRLVLSFWNL